MDHTPENHLQQSLQLAWQAAAQMRKAANLADQAAQLLQKALTQLDQENPSQPPVHMSVGTPKRKKQQRLRPESTKLIESTTLRQSEHPTMLAGMAEHASTSPPENVWDDGDNWWKPLQSTSSSEIDQSLLCVEISPEKML